MASRYRPLALTTHRSCADWLSLPVLALWIGAALLPAWAIAGDTPADTAVPLRPYTAEYKTTTRGFKLDIRRELRIGNDGSYILTNGGKIIVVGFHEVSVFRAEGRQIAPQSYIYQGTGMVNRRREVHFSPTPGSISSLYKKTWYELPYTATTLDRMSQFEQLRLTLLNEPDTPTDITLRVADGKRVKDSRLVKIADETLNTPLGPVETLHFERLHDDRERKSDIWVAPRWDYLMVKTVHIEDGEPVEMVITSATLAGEPVKIQ